ncbi:GTP pyrophosphokinase family protein [Pseudomonas sp. M30-35]|uniref:GTP pyrophosphokinase n=1 Tax=Pseudomonas sp. M30-35 TaxID=1981174 RepID=UPI000B3C93BE|nr:hypothetical protein [Pseudomonas sp. M30-35]ARU87464.1 hypothetical protein B9K09_05535 [Pseudomonas sp. M30-35]
MSEKNVSDIEQACVEYTRVRPDYVSYTSKVQTLFEDLLRVNEIDYHLIESRVKDVSSFRDKISRASKAYSDPLRELTDLGGIRIITYYQADVDDIAKCIRQQFEVDQHNSIEHSPDGAEFGYRSAHYVVQILAVRAKLPEWGGFADFKLEIQVRTVLQHAWAAISHKLQYKHEDDVPQKLRRKLFRLSALFELADDEFISLRDESIELSSAIDEKLSVGNKDIKIDFVSLSHYLNRSPEVAALCVCASEAGFVIEESRVDSDWLSGLVQLTSLLGVVDVSELDSDLAQALPKAKEYFQVQLERGNDEDPGLWTVTPEFICVLILIGVHAQKIEPEFFAPNDWSENIAWRVLNVAKMFDFRG